MPGHTPSPDAIPDEQHVLDQVRSMLAEVIGEDYVTSLEIVPETSFQEDLEIESIELVALGERLQEEYGHINFADWLATMEVDEIIAMTVGDLVAHIAASAPPPASVASPASVPSPASDAPGENHG